MPDTTADPSREAALWLLGEFLETEEIAREAGLDDVPDWEVSDDGRIMGADPRYHMVIVDRGGDPTMWQRQHMARHDPRTVLADIEAKRDIIHELSRDHSDDTHQALRRVVLRLAAALAHRPGYQQHWCPAIQDHGPEGTHGDSITRQDSSTEIADP